MSIYTKITITIHSATEAIRTSEGALTLMLMAVSTTEPVVMTFHSFLFLRPGLYGEAALVLLFTLPLWFFIMSEKKDGKLPTLRISPEVLFLAVLTGVFLSDYLVMMLHPSLMLISSQKSMNLADACFTTLFNAPPLLGLTCFTKKPGKQIPENIVICTPVRLYVLLLFMIFLADLLMDILYPLLFPNLSHIIYIVVDSFLSTLLIAPLLWWFLVKPLIRNNLSQGARVNAIYSQTVDAIITIDSAGIIESVNPAANRIFGYTADELTGRSGAQLFEGEQRNLDNIIRSTTENCCSEGNIASYEAIGRRRNGSIVNFDVSISRFLLEERLEYMMILRDISDRKKMEKEVKEGEVRFREIFEQSEDAIIFFKPGTSSIIDINLTTEKLYGYTKAELQEAGLKIFTRPEDFNLLANAISTIDKNRIVQMDKVVNIRKNGTEIIVSVRGKVMTLQGVDIIYCSFRDVTDQLRLEKEAHDVQSKLIQTNKMTSLGLLVSGVAHEINNPINFIMANSQLLERSWADSLKILREYYLENGEFFIGGISFTELEVNSPRLFAGITDGIKRVSSIINNLKSFARNDGPIETSDMNVNQVATSAVSILHYELNKFTDNFHLELAENIPIIKGSSQQLGQIIINLLMNACQALPSRQSGIWLTTDFDSSADQVTISVKDEGHGIPSEKSRLIMEPFFTTKLDSGGTGLGLSICQSIVKDHSWFMDFTSEQGKGSTFTVRIPAAAKRSLLNGKCKQYPEDRPSC